MPDTLNILEYLRREGLPGSLLEGVEEFRAAHPLPAGCEGRIPVPRFRYYGAEVWEMAVTAVLAGENLLLSGPKATGKNVLAENLSALFGRPQYDVSFHINSDAASLLGTDTFGDGEVRLRKGPVWLCAENGGFGVLDEINMAKNESLAVLHAVLDHRRVIDMPGYDRIRLNDAARFIATMNYGYAGTRELNEALTSRFVVLDMPRLEGDGIARLLTDEFPALKPAYAEQFALLFGEIRTKCDGGELSTRTLDLRGLLESVRLMKFGLPCSIALELGIVNKTFDGYEQQLVRDVIASRFPRGMSADLLFG